MLGAHHFYLYNFRLTCAVASLILPNPPDAPDPRLPGGQFGLKVYFPLPFPFGPSSENITKMVRNVQNYTISRSSYVLTFLSSNNRMEERFCVFHDADTTVYIAYTSFTT